MKNQQGVLGAKRLLWIQLGLTAVGAVIALCFSGAQSSVSVLFGGMTSALPSAVFAKILFAEQGAGRARQIAKRFYKGEATKIGMSIVLFALVFGCLDVNPLIYFAAYLAAQLALWFAPVIFVNKK